MLFFRASILAAADDCPCDCARLLPCPPPVGAIVVLLLPVREPLPVSPIILTLWLLWSTSLLSCLFKPRVSPPPYFGFFVNMRDKKSVSSYLVTPAPTIVPGWFSITFLYSFYSSSALLYNIIPPPDIRLPLALAETRSRLRSAMPPLSKTGELTPFSEASKEDWPAFHVGSRLLE